MSKALTVISGSTALAQPLEFTAEQTQMIRDTFANGASDSEFKMLMEIAKARRLSPILRQIWFVKRWDNQKKREVWAPQVSIDGLRAIAERTGLYDGQDEPEFEHDANKKPECVKVRVYKRGTSRPFVGVAHYAEYVQRTREGNPNKMWAEKPHIMLSKCAEALALRKAFPEDMAGLYTDDEIATDTAQVAHAQVSAVQPESASGLIARILGASTMDALAALAPEAKALPEGSPQRKAVASAMKARKAQIEVVPAVDAESPPAEYWETTDKESA